MNHIGSKQTSHAMYSALSDTHDNRAHITVTHLQQLIYETKASEGDNIPKHLDMLKSYRDRLNKFPNTEFHVSQQTKANLYSDQRQPKMTSRFYVWKWIFKCSRVLSKF